MANFQLFFSVQATGGSATWPDPENRVGDEGIGSPVGTASSALHVPDEQEHCSARTSLVVELPEAFSFKMSFNCTRRDE
jgi:hypothetical protein